jgi:hypothetical protein
VLLSMSLGFDFVMTISSRRAAERLSLGLQPVAAAAQLSYFGDGSVGRLRTHSEVAGGRAEGTPGPSTPAGPCCGQRRTGDAARSSESDPATSSERSDAKKQNDHGGSRARKMKAAESRALRADDRADERPAAPEARVQRCTRRSGAAAGPSATAGCSHSHSARQRGSCVRDGSPAGARPFAGSRGADGPARSRATPR